MRELSSYCVLVKSLEFSGGRLDLTMDVWTTKWIVDAVHPGGAEVRGYLV